MSTERIRNRARRSGRTAPPVSSWAVVLGDKLKILRRQGRARLGLSVGWSVHATLSTEVRDGIRVDSFTVVCVKGSVEVRTRAEYSAGDPVVACPPLQISTATGKPRVTIGFAPMRRAQRGVR